MNLVASGLFYLAIFLQSTDYIGHDICLTDLLTTKNM